MSKRSRKRARRGGGARSQPRPRPQRESADAEVELPEPKAKRAGRQSYMERMLEKADARPKPPWHPFPLVELAVFVGIVLIAFGFFTADSPRGRTALVFGMALASVAGLETALRDHFSGYRSHSMLLAGIAAIAVGVGILIAKAPYAVGVGVGVGVFALAFWQLRAAFRRKAGVGFKA